MNQEKVDAIFAIRLLLSGLVNILLRSTTMALLFLAFAVWLAVCGYQYLHSPEPDRKTILADFYANISTELASIAATVLIIDTLNGRRTSRQEKKTLIFQARSPHEIIAVEAIRILGDRGDLRNGSLQGADLSNGNLKGASLSFGKLKNARLHGAQLQNAALVGSDLRDAGLNSAKLHNASLNGANLQRAMLQTASLREAALHEADLRRSDLHLANLHGAALWKTNLCGANLLEANLEGAKLQHPVLGDAIFDPETILPDGIRWTGGIDMRRYTDPDNADFWRPPGHWYWWDDDKGE